MRLNSPGKTYMTSNSWHSRPKLLAIEFIIFPNDGSFGIGYELSSARLTCMKGSRFGFDFCTWDWTMLVIKEKTYKGSKGCSTFSISHFGVSWTFRLWAAALLQLINLLWHALKLSTCGAAEAWCFFSSPAESEPPECVESIIQPAAIPRRTSLQE